MTDWKPIQELKFHASPIYWVTEKVLLWVAKESGYYGGPIVGYFRKRANDSHVYVDVCGVDGYDWENEFEVEQITHWCELPEGPGD